MLRGLRWVAKDDLRLQFHNGLAGQFRLHDEDVRLLQLVGVNSCSRLSVHLTLVGREVLVALFEHWGAERSRAKPVWLLSS